IELGLIARPGFVMGAVFRRMAADAMMDSSRRACSRRDFLLSLNHAAALGAASFLPTIASAGEKQSMKVPVCMCYGDGLARYGFPAGHPLGVDRQGAFWREALAGGLDRRVHIEAPRTGSREEILRFHTAVYVDRVAHAAAQGLAFLDQGDTPVFPG